jgi:hypothetical protein
MFWSVRHNEYSPDADMYLYTSQQSTFWGACGCLLNSYCLISSFYFLVETWKKSFYFVSKFTTSRNLILISFSYFSSSPSAHYTKSSSVFVSPNYIDDFLSRVKRANIFISRYFSVFFLNSFTYYHKETLYLCCPEVKFFLSSHKIDIWIFFFNFSSSLSTHTLIKLFSSKNYAVNFKTF